MFLSWFNLDAFSIIKLSCLILSVVFAVHLYSIRGKTKGTLFGATAFTGASIFFLSMFIEFAGSYYWQPRSLSNALVPYLQNIGPSIALTSLILLSYHYSAFLRQHMLEAKLAVALSIALGIFIFLLCLYNFRILAMGRSEFGFQTTYFLITDPE